MCSVTAWCQVPPSPHAHLTTFSGVISTETTVATSGNAESRKQEATVKRGPDGPILMTSTRRTQTQTLPTSEIRIMRGTLSLPSSLPLKQARHDHGAQTGGHSFLPEEMFNNGTYSRYALRGLNRRVRGQLCKHFCDLHQQP
jgi:hypothetical protein